MRSLALVLSATALIAASSQSARADPVRPGEAPDTTNATSAAQSPSMLVGISGQLVALEVFLARWTAEGPADPRASSPAVAGDASSVLASHTISPFAMPPGLAHAPVHFDLASAQLQTVAGRLLAFVEGRPGLAGVDAPNPSGENGASVSGGPPAMLAGSGLGPSVFAQPAPTPEPTTLALVGSGLLLGAMGRRRLRKQQESLGK